MIVPRVYRSKFESRSEGLTFAPEITIDSVISVINVSFSFAARTLNFRHVPSDASSYPVDDFLNASPGRSKLVQCSDIALDIFLTDTAEAIYTIEDRLSGVYFRCGRDDRERVLWMACGHVGDVVGLGVESGVGDGVGLDVESGVGDGVGLGVESGVGDGVGLDLATARLMTWTGVRS